MKEESKAPEGILCSLTHEWLLEGEEYSTIGITDIGIEQMGEIVLVDLPEVGSEFARGEVFGTIESIREASEIYMPVSGKVIEINEELINSPEIINEDCFYQGWLIKIQSDTIQDDAVDLLEYEDYKEEVE